VLVNEAQIFIFNIWVVVDIFLVNLIIFQQVAVSATPFVVCFVSLAHVFDFIVCYAGSVCLNPNICIGCVRHALDVPSTWFSDGLPGRFDDDGCTMFCGNGNDFIQSHRVWKWFPAFQFNIADFPPVLNVRIVVPDLSQHIQ
jgi:hypothetical protein